MKKWMMFLATAAMSASLVACNKGGGGSSTTVTGPTSCANYARDAYGRYIDPTTGQAVNCDPNYWGGGVGGINCQPAPHEGCAGWSRCFPGNTYVEMPVNGQIMCVNTAYFWQMPNFGYYYGQYGYPTSTCIPGMNCSSSCVSLGGGTSGSSGGYFFGGNVNFCF